MIRIGWRAATWWHFFRVQIIAWLNVGFWTIFGPKGLIPWIITAICLIITDGLLDIWHLTKTEKEKNEY